MRGADKDSVEIRGAMRPVPAMRVARAAPARPQPLLRAALESVRPALVVLDTEGAVSLVTGAAAELLGLPPGAAAPGQGMEAMLGRSLVLDAAARQTLAAAFSGGMRERELLLSLPPAPGGSVARVVHLTIRKAGRHGWVLGFEDVTERRSAEAFFLEHAATDPLTGLLNRQHFMLLLQDRLAADGAGDAAVLLIDLNRFRPVNDALGHAVGDALLRLVGSRLRGVLREGDRLARLADDEFCVLLAPAPPRADLVALGDRLVETLARPFSIEGQVIVVGASIGIARAPEHGSSPELLLKSANLALAAAKSAGGVGAWRFFDPRLDARARARRRLEVELRQAVADGAFELHYQPQIDLKQQCIVGFEALLRWRNGEAGYIPPLDFIPLAEELGLIGAIGEWVLLAACREAMRWPRDIAVAVNASPLQFDSGGFAGIVGRALAASGLPGRRLEIEVTENLLLRDHGTVTAALEALRGLGVRLVLDDFGTGYASLSQLSRFRFDKIKIDRSFLGAEGEAREHDAIVTAIAALGVSLGIPTTAEGVETVVQLERVRADGCTCVQGYYYSRPVPASAVPGLLASMPATEEVM